MKVYVALLVAALCSACPAATVNLKVTAEPLCNAAEISPMQYGQFVEYLCDLVPGMWAEKLYDNGFEGLSPYKFQFIKETDNKEKPWHPSGAVNRAKYDLDHDTKGGGDVSQRIAVGDGAPATVGISQDGIFAAKDESLTFSCWLRGEGLKGKVAVRVHRDGRAFAETEFEPAGEWRRFSAKLVTTDAAHDATLTIEFRGPGTLWIDNATLMPDENEADWRPNVVAALRELKPGVIRFGGSAMEGGELGDLEWKNLIGDPDHRKPFRAWGGLQPQGAGIEEFVQLCQAVGAEPLMCVRFSGRSPKDAADEVEYFNGAAGTPMGALRAKSGCFDLYDKADGLPPKEGHPKPYHIKLWQIGNEIGGDDYVARVGDFARAMKKVDPSIQILSSFPNAKFVANAGDMIDYVCPHHYTRDLAGEERDLLNIEKMIRDNAPPGRADKIKIAVTEWNTTAGDFGLGRATLWALENALSISRYHNMLHRHADVVQIANRSNLTNSFCSGIIQTDHAGRLYKTPTYYAQQLYATNGQAIAFKIDGDARPLDISATTSADHKHVALFVVNPTANQVSAQVDVSAFAVNGKKVEIHTLADRDRANEPDAANSFADPQRIAVTISTGPATGGVLAHDFPAYTLTVLRWY